MDFAYITGPRKGDILKIQLPDIQNNELHIVTEKKKTELVFSVVPIFALFALLIFFCKFSDELC